MPPAAAAPAKPPTASDPGAVDGAAAFEFAKPEVSAPKRIAIAYSPELVDPMAASIPGGSFVVAFVHRDARIILEPGLNFGIDADLWEEAKARPATADLIAMRAIEEIDLGGDTVGSTAAAGVSAVKNVDEPTALKLVHCSRDAKQLETWLGLEERISIRNAITRKLNQLKEGQG